LVHEIGKGGFSEVYSCSRAAANGGNGMEPYAIKIVPKTKSNKVGGENGEMEIEAEEGEAEARIHRRLVHENIVRCVHSFCDETKTFLILELCHNESIKHMLNRRQSHRLTEPEVKYYLKQLVGALKYLHDERYVVHRDVKPANLLLDKTMQLKLADFGLATELQATQIDGGCAKIVKGSGGSPAFMAPESIKAKDGRITRHAPSFEVDIWSVGVVCFTALAGRSPFAASDVEATYGRILDNEFEFLDDVDVSDDARDLISRILRTDPSDRLSLDEIGLHPFFTRHPGKIPKSIPLSATHVKPEWKSNKRGVIYATTCKKVVNPQFRLPNISSATGQLESCCDLPSVPSAVEMSVEDETNVADATVVSSNNLTAEGEARAAFFDQERAHQQLYTKAMVEWGVAEYARRQTQKRRRENTSDQFVRAFVDPEEIKEDAAFMELLIKKCELAYKSLYGHRTGGTVRIIDNVDPNVLGKYGKIVAVDEDPTDPEKISFKIELQQKKLGGIIEYATALPSDIEMKSKTDGGSPKKGGKKGKANKKGGKKSSAAKSGPPSEYDISLQPLYDLDIVVTKSDLDSVTTEPSGMTYILDDMMAKRNEEAGHKEVEQQRFQEESKKAEREALEKEELMGMNHIVKLLKKKARRVRSDQDMERVPLSERFEVDELLSEFFKEGGSDRTNKMIEAHFELILDSLTDLFDVLECRSLPPELFELLLSNKELLLLIESLRYPEPALPMNFFLDSLVFHVGAAPAGDRVLLMFEDFPFASVDASDPRLAFIKMRIFDEVDDEEMCQEQNEEHLSCYADLLGVSVDADAKTIKKAFRKQSMQCHPDKAESNGLTVEEAEEKFKALSEAKTTLLASCEENE